MNTSEFVSKRIALITGASSGIGAATARLLASNGFDLILCARRKDRLRALRLELLQECNVITLCFDVSKREDVFNAIKSLPVEWRRIDLLLNNAGNAHGLDSFENADLDDWDLMIDVNVKGLIYVTKATLPYMLANKKGHIINIGSIAGMDVYPSGNVYCATKSAVAVLNQSMRMDLLEKGIKVSEIRPGLVETEFSTVRFKGNDEKAEAVYKGMTPLKAQDVAELIHFMLTRPAHVNLAEILLLPADQAQSKIVRRR